MAAPRAAWGIEIGADALKGIRLERDGDEVRVTDFAHIPHKKSLTDPDADADDSIRITLGALMTRKDLEGEHVVMSVPGHESFARFAKLPPVEPKKVPDIVKFEAVQQIPFPIEEVEWDYETFAREGSPELEVGIFAIRRDRIQRRLELYRDVSLVPEAITLSPVALFNAVSHDMRVQPGGKPIVILDIGSQSTDVIIADGSKCWIRTFQLGGTHFTAAIQEAFKLGYGKADRLKREASTSKYAKQIMQAMRPIFSDLLEDLQRSLNYYRQMNPGVELEEMVGVGSTFKIPGLRKFIGQQLQINVTRLDEFARINVTGREAASFAEHAVNMATAYGLALQGVGLAKIEANLMPVGSLRESLWAQKTKWFAAAAAIVVAGAATTLYHPLVQGASVGAVLPGEAARTIAEAKQNTGELDAVRSGSGTGFTGTNFLRLADHRDVWPHLIADATAALASTNPAPEELSASPEVRRSVDPKTARLVHLAMLDATYRTSGDRRLLDVAIDVTLTHDRPLEFLTETVAAWLRENADRPGVPYRIVAEATEAEQAAGLAGISVNPQLLQSGAADEAGRIPDSFSGITIPGGRSGGAPAMPGGGSGDRGAPGAAPSGGAPGFGGGDGGGRRMGGSQRGAPGSGLGGGDGGGVPGFGGGDGGGRRMGGAQRGAPGSGLGSGSGSGAPDVGGGVVPPAGGSPGFTRPAGPAGRTAGGDASDPDLDTIAPIEPPMGGLEPGTTVHRARITFTIELRSATDAPGDMTADGSRSGTRSTEDRS